MDIEREYYNMMKSVDKITESATLTEDQVNEIDKVLEENIENTPDLKLVQSLPSNNGVSENTDSDQGYMKKANIVVDPYTGENKIVSTVNEDEESIDDMSFEDLVAGIESGEIKVPEDDTPISKEELKSNFGILDDNGNITVSDEDFMTILEVVNRRNNKEDFNVYKALPKVIQRQIDEGIGLPPEGSSVITNNPIRAMRNATAEALIDEVLLHSTMERAQTNLNKEIEEVFKSTASEVAEYSIGYTKERNEKYREYAEGLEDEEKKKKLLETLDVIDSAYDLNVLKEFAKTCKIKKYDIENPKNYFRDFMYKYKDQAYNIYDINLTLPMLERHIVDDENYNKADIVAFMVCFCKYIRNFNVENTLDHAFMYYVIYNICIVDSLPESSKEVSDKFMNNIKEVINNLKERNPFLK